MNEKSQQLANLLKTKILGGKILNIQLSDKNNPHFAKIILQNFQNKKIAAIIELQKETPENILTSAILWFTELEQLKTKSAEKLWIVSSQTEKLSKIYDNLKLDWQKKIRIFDLELNERNDDFAALKKIKFRKPKKNNSIIEQIISIAPNQIQLSHNQLTFCGLPFIRINGSQAWFGVETQSQILSNSNWNELIQLIENLKLYRHINSPSKTHIFYRLLPEAWLESILRRDISVLDSNLILSPVHHQFRTSSEKIDILALRTDGRLVIIELKVFPNREHLFQSVDYWQEIEAQRKAGNLEGLFGELKISNEPSLIYLTAPHSAFHPSLEVLANTVDNKVEIFRFDLDQKWREKVRVIERKKLQASE